MIPDPQLEKRRIIVLKPFQRRHRAYVHAANKAGTTLKKWSFAVLDRAAGYAEELTEDETKN